MSTTFAQYQAEVAAVLGIDNVDEATNAARYAKAGLRAISRAGAWEWLHAHYGTGIPTVAGTYNYALPTDLFRLDTQSVRTGGRETYLGWRRQVWIDGELGPDWKDVATTTGTPQYATRVGGELWIACKPSTAWVASNAALYFYYWRSEAMSGALYLPDEFLDVAVQAALIYGMLSEDDPRSDGLLQKWNNVWLPEMRGAKLDMNSGNQMNQPDWMWWQSDDSDSIYIGEGYGR